MSDRNKTILENITELLEPLLAEKNFELVDIEFKTEGRGKLLRIFIDKSGGITVDECAEVSREFGTLLDVNDLIESSYRLEISSPGLRRPLKKPQDFTRYEGRKIKLKTYAPVHERKTFTGELLGYKDGEVSVSADGVIYQIPYEMISKANLEIDF